MFFTASNSHAAASSPLYIQAVDWKNHCMALIEDSLASKSQSAGERESSAMCLGYFFGTLDAAYLAYFGNHKRTCRTPYQKQRVAQILLEFLDSLKHLKPDILKATKTTEMVYSVVLSVCKE